MVVRNVLVGRVCGGGGVPNCFFAVRCTNAFANDEDKRYSVYLVSNYIAPDGKEFDVEFLLTHKDTDIVDREEGLKAEEVFTWLVDHGDW